jgi:uncharacterized protein YggU (UPF0235/DUF167 family)
VVTTPHPAARTATAVVVEEGAVRLRVRLTPRAARDALGDTETLADGTEVVVAHVRAVPSGGAANAALTALVAAEVGVAKSRVGIVAGATARVKTVRIEGDPAAIVAALAARGDAASHASRSRTPRRP